MNILIIANGYPPDGEFLGLFEYDQAKALAAAGHDVIFLALDMRSVLHWRRWGLSRADDKRMKVYRMSFPGGRLPLFIKGLLGRIAFSSAIKRILKDAGHIDIAQAHFTDNGVYANKTCKRYGIPLVVTEHSSKINKDTLSPSVQKWALNAYKNADCLLAVSHALAKRIYKHTGITAQVIPNIVDLSCFHYVQRPGNNGFRFVSTGNLIQTKGFDTLLKAFAQAFPDDSTVRLTIIGDGQERQNLESLCMQLGISDKVTFTGRLMRDRLQAEYENADAFILASRSETFGVSYIEAMATGMPIIATKCGGPEDFLNEHNGFAVPVDDVFSLTQALVQMHEKIGRFDHIKISDEVIEKFSPDTIAKQLTQCFELVLAKKGQNI